MPGSLPIDVPSPIDLRAMADAQEWEASAMSKRPWRTDFFDCFAAALGSHSPQVSRVLELGSGPGFLAQKLLTALPSASYVALDFSPAMHELAARRLGPLAHRARFVERSFLDEDWTAGLGEFDSVVTHQAAHEVRHKSRASKLHAQVARLLRPGGAYLVCDHFAGEGGMKDDQLFMSVEEQRAALKAAGFVRIEQLLHKGGMVLHRASLQD
jgi:SAM-dependent methyltransferase